MIPRRPGVLVVRTPFPYTCITPRDARAWRVHASCVTCTTATSPRGPYSLTKEARRFARLGQLRVQPGRRLVALESFGEFAHLLIYDAQVKMSVRVIRIERDGAREMVCARDAKDCAPSDSLLAKRVHRASARHAAHVARSMSLRAW